MSSEEERNERRSFTAVRGKSSQSCLSDERRNKASKESQKLVLMICKQLSFCLSSFLASFSLFFSVFADVPQDF